MIIFNSKYNISFISGVTEEYSNKEKFVKELYNLHTKGYLFNITCSDGLKPSIRGYRANISLNKFKKVIGSHGKNSIIASQI